MGPLAVTLGGVHAGGGAGAGVAGGGAAAGVAGGAGAGGAGVLPPLRLVTLPLSLSIRHRYLEVSSTQY